MFRTRHGWFNFDVNGYPVHNHVNWRDSQKNLISKKWIAFCNDRKFKKEVNKRILGNG